MKNLEAFLFLSRSYSVISLDGLVEIKGKLSFGSRCFDPIYCRRKEYVEPYLHSSLRLYDVVHI
jgi:hypothetical protein